MESRVNWYGASTGDSDFDRWATGESDPGQRYDAYSYVRVKDDSGVFRMSDKYNAGLGISWIYFAKQIGNYRLELDELKIGSYARAQVLYKPSADEDWVDLSGVMSNNSKMTDLAYEAALGKGGAFAFRAWNSCSMVATAVCDFGGLRIRYLGSSGEPPVLSMSVSSPTVEENPLLDATPEKVIRFTLDHVGAEDVEIPLVVSGGAQLGVDYVLDIEDIVIPAGFKSVYRTLKAIDNITNDGDRTIVLSIGDVEGAVKAPESSVELTLVDDDKPISKKGDVLRATVFLGGEAGTSGGNPNLSGQGWYQKDMTTPLNYFTSDGTPRWSTYETRHDHDYTTLRAVEFNKIEVRDAWYAARGVAWITSFQEPGDYVISCASCRGSYQNIEMLWRKTAQDAWTQLGSQFGGAAFAFTNYCKKGGGFALKMSNTNKMAADGTFLLEDLKVEYLGKRMGLMIYVK